MLEDKLENKQNILLKHLPLLKQFIKFCTVGVVVTLFDFGLYFILTRGFAFLGEHFLYANVISFSFAVIVSYSLHKRWTFQHEGPHRVTTYAQFFMVSFVGLLLNQFILYSLVSYLLFYDLIAKIIATGVVVLWRFLINKFWVFR